MIKYFYIAFALYLLIISIIAIVATIKDKRAAEQNKWRTKEKTLILISFLGGSIAMLITMRKIRHKTKHLKFMLGIPFIIAFQLLLLAAIIYLAWRQSGSFDFLLPT